MKDYLTLHINKKSLMNLLYLVIIFIGVMSLIILLGYIQKSIHTSGYNEGYDIGTYDARRNLILGVIDSKAANWIIFEDSQTNKSRTLFFKECQIQSSIFANPNKLKEVKTNGS